MTEPYGICMRCGIDVSDENWGTTLYDDGAGLTRHDDVLFCDECRDDFEEWVESTS